MNGLVKCPICGNTLFERKNSSGNSYICFSGHTFDIAKEGYVNLLPANAKNSLAPGDNKIMVNARNAFLSKGHFYPLSQAVAEKISGELVLDAGCGTGYYGRAINKYAQNNAREIKLYGIDISKFAVRLAAKSGYFFTAVSSVFNMPFSNENFDCAISIFAPVCVEELCRVLKTGGKLITVTPAENHLIELKQALYKDDTYLNPPENAQKPLKTKSGEQPFKIISTQRITFRSNVKSGEELSALLTMTPYFYKTHDSQKAVIYAMPDTVCTFDFYLTVYQK